MLELYKLERLMWRCSTFDFRAAAISYGTTCGSSKVERQLSKVEKKQHTNEQKFQICTLGTFIKCWFYDWCGLEKHR